MREVRQVTQAAARAHAMPVIVAYNLPDRDACGKFSGRRGPTGRVQGWINQLAAAIGAGATSWSWSPMGWRTSCGAA